MWNVHRMFITQMHNIKHRNSETRNDFLIQVRNFLLPLSLKVLRHKKRDTHSFYSGFSICPTPTRAYPTRCKASASKRKSTVFYRGRTQLNSTNWLFSNPPKSSAHASDAWRHSHPQALSGIFILTSVNDTSSPRECQHLCSSLHLTNPCAEPKGSQPN